MSVHIAFSYPASALAMTKTFRVFQVDPTTKARSPSSPVVTIAPIAPATTPTVPTMAAPAIVPLTGYGILAIEVVAFDGTQEGASEYLQVYSQLPAVTALSVIGGL